ncbi:MAG: Crp/Fnr family transcriptional regulator [Alphaproteobacteria bacterium HGW-Alphaproteobacteria-2]|nr:MAG: Crp/Fnr family transcriptional regulator [Alphaproteobacteria bacterium HGW-Alphaproteobacteria-2]
MSPPDWSGRLAGLADLDPATRADLVRRSRVVRLPAGATVFAAGQEAANLLFVLSGTVRVSQTSDSGREVVLYRVEAGESCIMTAACLMGDAPYLAEGVAETDIEAVAIPRSVFDDLAARSGAFRAFVFAAYAQRMLDLFQIVDEVAFGRVDIRLAQRLVTLARGESDLRITHQQLAAELGTAREVISRQLQDFQRRGWIAQARGVISLANPAALAGLAGG